MANIVMLNESVLKSLFNERYMTFDLCVQLEPVSKLFAQHAHSFYRNVTHLDVNHFLANCVNVNWARKVHRRCPNLTQITSFEVKKESLEQDLLLAQTVGKLKHISSVGMIFLHFESRALFSLIDVPSLSQVQISSRYRNVVVTGSCIEKTAIDSFSCDRLSLVNLCDADFLKSLHINCEEINSEELIEAMKDFKNLEDVVLEVNFYEDIEEIQEAIDFFSNVLQVDRLSLQILNYMRDDVLSQFFTHHRITKFVTGLAINKIGVELLPRLFELSRLEYLHLEYVTYCTDAFFKSLPNLTHFEIESFEWLVMPDKDDAQFDFFTLYKKYDLSCCKISSYATCTYMHNLCFRPKGSVSFNVTCKITVFVTELEELGDAPSAFKVNYCFP